MFKFVFIQRTLDGTILGIVEVHPYSDKTEFNDKPKSNLDDATYYYSVQLNRDECRVLELIRQFNTNKKDFICVDMNSQPRLVYKRCQSNFHLFSIYNMCIDHGKPIIKELLTFNNPDHLGGVLTSDNYVIAYPSILAKERGSLYIRNITTSKWNFLKLPDIIKNGHQFRHVSL